jgi:hypothetical protein
MHFFAREYSTALGRTITYQDIPVVPWRDGLLERGLPVHLVNHLATMADLHRAGRYDRMSNDVRTLTGQEPLSVQDFVRNNMATFTASAKEARVSAATIAPAWLRQQRHRTPANRRKIRGISEVRQRGHRTSRHRSVQRFHFRGRQNMGSLEGCGRSK